MTQEKLDELEQDIEFLRTNYRAKWLLGAMEHEGKDDDFDKLSVIELLEESIDEKLDDLAYTLKAIRMLRKKK